jgi:hypothetical protein
VLCESTGSTINNTLRFHKSKDYIQKNKDMFTHPTYFMKYLFEITYTLYCLNTKIGVIHSDLHLNNTTLNSLYYPYFDYQQKELNIKPGDEDVIIYHIGSEMYYSFPHIIKYATVIDFSRSIIKTKHIKKHFQSSSDKKLFNMKQVATIIRWYATHMPDLFTEYQTEIKKACDTRFDVVFKLFSAIDMYYHSVLLLKFFDTHTNVEKHATVEKTLKKITVITRHYLESGMRNIAQNINWVCEEWPNLDIIKRCFTDHMVDLSDSKSIKRMNVVDFFNYDNPLKYDFHDPKKTAPRFKTIMHAEKNWGEPGYKTAVSRLGISGNQGAHRTAYNKSTDDWISTMNNYVHK